MAYTLESTAPTFSVMGTLLRPKAQTCLKENKEYIMIRTSASRTDGKFDRLHSMTSQPLIATERSIVYKACVHICPVPPCLWRQEELAITCRKETTHVTYYFQRIVQVGFHARSARYGRRREKGGCSQTPELKTS